VAFERAEVTLIGGEITVLKHLLKSTIRDLQRADNGYRAHMAQPYISVLDKIIEATREVQ